MSAKIRTLGGEAWLYHFRTAVDQLGATKVKKRLGCSATTVSQIYNNKYPSPTDKWRDRFLAEFTPGSVECPVLGEISRDACSFHRKREFAATNPQRVQLYHACRSCINNPDRIEE